MKIEKDNLSKYPHLFKFLNESACASLGILFNAAIHKEQKVGLDACANRLNKQNVTNFKRSISITKIFKLGLANKPI